MNATAEPELSVLAVGIDPGSIEGCFVERADDMLGALAHLSDGGIDVVFASLHLPDASGSDVVVSLRERAPDVPIIAVAEEPGDLGAALRAGASDVLPPDAATDTVARAIRYATSLQKVEAELRRHQTVDERTGLFNSRGFELLAGHHLRLADRSKHPVVIVFVRVDVPAGTSVDAAIADAAELIRSTVRASDVAARVGVDAFCVLLAGAISGSETIVLERIVEAVAGRNARSGQEAGPPISLGSATYDPEHPTSLQDLIAEADRRMRQQEGRAGPDGAR
jgi:diguanylate cyclase (GGDEF)-like protein